ncbi:ABC transporter ATP-binding protein [Pseudoalteromonas luteoviolacea]|uniref:ABC transporter n=1 Tax=Pseudoalteromonas luteoviolacea H33 TaxID=1365251 RepID=A0A167GGY1_9GAMM|nr:ABC transporter ATP-binding protein [Pseudoalteromonas luteoviolacea]KZN55436.1 ABC transporter [Pseudoalteromonas luteoviolacea H33]KZN74438.1 ABC transporter [Pseudoalteromonas luteoviolacea H33-S]MBQ4879793.1 ABC transporter ATP-binding protein [Pseudoalteromonas luteoviolacea]MBQ4908903.1 ABC transporter ATP-binding protein [Pseudoalteromonas luteoviolacea]
MANTPVIELINVSKVYISKDVETHALTDINLSIHKGDYISISGPSGCGKSTLLSLMGLLDDITDGSYKIEGVDTRSLDADTLAELRNLHIGFIFQSFNLIDELSVFDNVALPLIYREQALSQEDINTRVTRALSQVEIEHRANHKPNQLSGGQQQRVAIARALAGEPSILLVDEPTGNLDSKNGDAVMAILESLNQQGTTICMVTHDPRYAGYAKKQIKLFDGAVLNTSELGSKALRKMA